jgi:hypothetical protein
MTVKVEIHFANGAVEEYSVEPGSMLRRIAAPQPGTPRPEPTAEDDSSAVRALYAIGAAFHVFDQEVSL